MIKRESTFYNLTAIFSLPLPKVAARFEPLTLGFHHFATAASQVFHNQGDQIERFCANWATFLRLIMIFWKNEVAKNNGYFRGYFVFKQIH